MKNNNKTRSSVTVQCVYLQFHFRYFRLFATVICGCVNAKLVCVSIPDMFVCVREREGCRHKNIQVNSGFIATASILDTHQRYPKLRICPSITSSSSYIYINNISRWICYLVKHRWTLRYVRVAKHLIQIFVYCPTKNIDDDKIYIIFILFFCCSALIFYYKILIEAELFMHCFLVARMKIGHAHTVNLICNDGPADLGFLYNIYTDIYCIWAERAQWYVVRLDRTSCMIDIVNEWLIRGMCVCACVLYVVWTWQRYRCASSSGQVQSKVVLALCHDRATQLVCTESMHADTHTRARSR